MTDSTTCNTAPGTTKNCGLAITGFILALLSFLCCLGPVTGIPGAICGHVAQSRIKRSGGALGGGGLALTAIVMGWISCAMIVVWLILSGMLLPAVAQARGRAHQALSQNHANQLAIACTMYALEHDEMLPDSLEQLRESDVFDGPLPSSPFAPEGETSCGYELVARGKISAYDNPSTTVLLRDKYTAKDGARVVAYLDGHVEVVREE